MGAGSLFGGHALNQWCNKGFAGSWTWSLLSENTNNRIPTDLAAMSAFNSQHSEIGPKSMGVIAEAALLQ